MQIQTSFKRAKYKVESYPWTVAVVTFRCTVQNTFLIKSVLDSVAEMSQWWRYYISATPSKMEQASVRRIWQFGLV